MFDRHGSSDLPDQRKSSLKMTPILEWRNRIFLTGYIAEKSLDELKGEG